MKKNNENAVAFLSIGCLDAFRNGVDTGDFLNPLHKYTSTQVLYFFQKNSLLYLRNSFIFCTFAAGKSLDEEAQEDLRANKNFGTYKGAIYENIVGEMLRKSGYGQLYFYRHDNPAIEMDFFVRDADSLIPIEVKAKDGATASLNNLIKWESFPDVKFGVKLGYKNIGWNGQFYTFPYFLAFLLKRFFKDRQGK